MAWIESHQALGRHPKLIRLARTLGVSKRDAVGLMHYLWWWAIDYAPSGDLSGLINAEVAVAAEWDGDAKVLRDALSACGFVDSDGRLHDWDDYAGRLISTRERDAKRKRDVRRTSTGRPATVHRTQQTQPNPTDTTQQTQPTVPLPPRAIVVGWFDSLWTKYPSKDGRKAAEKSFLATVRSIEDLRRITKALDNYLASDRVRNGYVKNGSTWFNNWADWVDYVEPPKGATNGKKPANSFQGDGKDPAGDRRDATPTVTL